MAVMAYRAGERRCTSAVDVCPSKVRLAAMEIRATVRGLYQCGRCMAAEGTAGGYGDTGGFTYSDLYCRRMPAECTAGGNGNTRWSARLNRNGRSVRNERNGR